jgi:hypothetical protein
MNSIEHATSPGAITPSPQATRFWVVNSAVWSAYGAALMIPWLGQYSVLDMLPNKLAIAACGVAVSGALRAAHRWLRKQLLSDLLFLLAALAACVGGAFLLDTSVIALTQGPEAILQRWDGTFGSLIGGVPMPGRIGQYLILLVAWSLGVHLFDQQRLGPPAGPSAASQSTTTTVTDSTLAVSGTTVRARDGNRTILLDRDEIDWISADGDYIRVHNGPKNFLVRATMKHSANILGPLGFVRVHRSAIVNPRRVREIVRDGNDHTVVLKAGARIRTGRNYLAELDRLTGSRGEPGV